LGKHPQVCITTTPKPTKLIRDILKNPKTVVTTGSTFDNASNLAETYIESVRTTYEGSRIGRQELYAEILDEASGALWTRDLLARCEVEIPDPVEFASTLNRVVVSVDPAVTSNAESDMTGIIVAGVDVNGVCYVLEDATDRFTPEQWATKAVELYNKYSADRLVAERNQGGDMVRSTFKTVDETIPVKLVHASRGKFARAEPVSSLYERGRVKHARGLDALEDQLVQWCPLGSIGSPDRLDALVWAITELALKGVARPDLNLAYSDAKGLQR
jgi:phage terminase large subunit-like protein